MKYIIIFLVPWFCLYWIYKIILALAINASRISREEEYETGVIRKETNHD